MKNKVKTLWKKGHNVWQISQLTSLTEEKILEIVNGI